MDELVLYCNECNKFSSQCYTCDKRCMWCKKDTGVAIVANIALLNVLAAIAQKLP